MLPVSAIAARVPAASATPMPGPTPGGLRLRHAEGAERIAERLGGLPGGGPAQPSDGVAFSDTLRQAVGRVDAAQKTADARIEAFVAGESDNVHDAMIAMNEAELHFQLLAEVRNKLLDGYQELMRMQV